MMEFLVRWQAPYFVCRRYGGTARNSLCILGGVLF